MTFVCPNTRYPHTHELVYEARVCVGLIQPPRPAPAAPREPQATGRQILYIRDLGGDMEAARKMTKSQASAEIDRLRKGGARMTTPAVPAPRAAEVYDKRLDMIAQLLVNVPDGYFAVQEDEGGHTDFLRISRPKPHARHYANSIKVQTQHGDRLEVAAAFFDSGHKSVYRRSVIPMLMLLVVDWRGAAIRYAKEIGRCCRCNAQLTDDRSRHYGIGPECEGHWPEIISMVDEQNEGSSFEYLTRG